MPDLVTCATNVKLRTAKALREVAQVEEDSNSSQNVRNTHPQDIRTVHMLAEMYPVSHDDHAVEGQGQEHQGGQP